MQELKRTEMRMFWRSLQRSSQNDVTICFM